MSSPSRTVVRFGNFEADLRSGELRKQGRLVKVPAQPFQVLTLLLERPGDLITRDDLRARLWPSDTFVDFDRGLNKAVNRLREALGDDAESPRFIETLPKRGYRFIAPVARDNGEHAGAVDAMSELGEPAPHGPSAGPDIQRREPGKRRALWLLGAALVLAAAGAVVVWGWRRPAPLTRQDRVVVADFENRTGDPAFTHTLKQALTIELERSRLAHVVTEREVASTLKLMQRQGRALTPDVAAEVCGRTGSKALLTGSVDRLGGEYVLAIEAAECRTGNVLARAQGRSRSKEGVLDALADATIRLRRTLGEALSGIPSRDDRVHAVLSTASLEAFEAYTTGEQMVLQGRSPMPLFKQAIQRDPDFAYAHAALGLVYGALGETTLSAASTQRAYELRARVSDWEQYFITTQYLLQVTGELEKLPALCQAWIARYPNDRTAHNRLAFAYRQLGDLERAAKTYEQARRIGGDHPVDLQMQATTYMNLGRFDQAVHIVAAERLKTPEARRMLLLDYLLQFARSSQISPPATGAHGVADGDELTYARSNTAAYQGRLNEARRLTSMAIEAAQRQGFDGRAALWLANAALRDALAGRIDVARRGGREALALSDAWDVQAIAALALARSGEVTEAAAIAERLSTMLPRHTLLQRYWLPAIRADIALAQGQPRLAVEVLSTVSGHELAGTSMAAAPPLYAVYLRGLAHLGAGRAADAATDFQQIAEQRGIVTNHLVGALAELQLARAHAAAGSVDKAGQHYGRFVATWARSDADNAILAAARRELSRLQGQ